MRPRISVTAGALLIGLLAPASAQALVQMDPLKPCYVTAGTKNHPQREGFAVHAVGFSANALVDLAIDGTPVPDGTGLQASDMGALTLQDLVPAPWIKRGSRDFTVTLTEQGNPANVVSATAKTTALTVAVKPRHGHPSQVIRFRANGFTGAGPVFAHYVYKSKLRKTVRMVRAPGECGTWTVRRQQIPIKDPKPGLWTVQFDQSRRYVNGNLGTLRSVYVRLPISVRLVRLSPSPRASARS